MNATSTAAVVGADLSKNVFELAVADEHWRVVERARLSRSQFERWFAPAPNDAVNSAGDFTSAAWIDWRTGARSFHVGTGHTEPTHDAGYTTAGSTQMPKQSIRLFLLGGRPGDVPKSVERVS